VTQSVLKSVFKTGMEHNIMSPNTVIGADLGTRLEE